MEKDDTAERDSLYWSQKSTENLNLCLREKETG